MKNHRTPLIWVIAQQHSIYRCQGYSGLPFLMNETENEAADPWKMYYLKGYLTTRFCGKELKQGHKIEKSEGLNTRGQHALYLPGASATYQYPQAHFRGRMWLFRSIAVTWQGRRMQNVQHMRVAQAGQRSMGEDGISERAKKIG